MENDDLPEIGWWPEEFTICQWYRFNGRSVAQVVKQGTRGWRAFSMIELNKSGTTGKPLDDTVESIEQAKQLCEDYAKRKAT
jgi:hypothetical protein